MLAIIGASGKLGGATLDALLKYKLTPTENIVALTSSTEGSDTWTKLKSKGVHVRFGSFEDASSLEVALKGVDKLFLVSTPRIELDFNNAPPGKGRESHHKVAIDAARTAGVAHIYYSSLGFANPSKAGVMQAHIRTEAYLDSLDDIKFTVIREGLYNESWPLYLGYYNPKGDDRGTVPLGGDGKISWTAIPDLGLGNALVLVAPGEEYAGKTFYLSTPADTAKTMKEVAALVGQARGNDVTVDIVGRKEHEKYYIEKRSVPAPAVEWWASTYDALEAGECLINDPTLMKLLENRGQKPITMEQTIKDMVSS